MTTLPQTTAVQLPRPVPVGPATLGPTSVALPTISSQAPMTGADMWRVIRSNLWLIVGSLLASLILGFLLNWYLAAFHARYTATGYVEIKPGIPYDPTGRLVPGTYEQLGPNALLVEQRSQTAMLKTDTLFTQVLSDPNATIRATTWFNQFKRPDDTVDIAEAKDDLYDKFAVTPITDSKLIAVSFTYHVPNDCRIVVENIVDKHLENERKRVADKTVGRQQLLNNLRVRYETRIRELKQEITLKAAKLQIDGFGRPGGIGQKEMELQQLLLERIKAENDAAEARGRYESAKASIEQGITPSEVEMMVNQSPSVMRLKQLVDDYDIRLRALANQGTESRIYRQLTLEREATQQKLDEVRAEERANNTVMFLESSSARAAATENLVKQINQQMENIRNDLADITSTLSDYLTKKDEEQSYQELLRRVRDQIDVLNNQMLSRELNTVDWGPKPVTPDTPSFPRLPVTVSFCMAMGLVISLGISFLRELLDTSVRSPRDIARVGQMNFLGMISHEDDDPQSAGVPLSTVIYAAPTSIIAEQFRQVRTRLQHAAALDATRSIMITSPGPEDGKSTVACNLAAGLALNGRRILLVDANFRRPELHRIFGVGNERGFGNVLIAMDHYESAIHHTKVPNLDLMTAGQRPANATELLESQLLIDFIEKALEEYDHVIFDTGPLLFVSETVALAPRVDGVVTVVRARVNSRGLLQRMRDTLRQLKAEHLGVVLNGVRVVGGGYYGRNIRTYYQYLNSGVQQAQSSS